MPLGVGVGLEATQAPLAARAKQGFDMRIGQTGARQVCRTASCVTAACAALTVLVACSAEVADSQGRTPTPEITAFEAIEVPDAIAYAARAPLGDTGSFVGLAIVCRPDASQPAEVTLYFGAFPRDRRPVQLAVRTDDGQAAHFGQAVRAGPESGFHSPRLTRLEEARHFLRLALRPGSLVSNGYNSFRNRIGAADNRTVLDAFLSCAR